MTETSEQTRVLRLERVFNATPDRVYRAWAEPEQMLKWWGPQGCTVPEHSINSAVGGAYTTTMQLPDGSRHTVSGVFKELVPGQRIVMTWAWVQEDGSRGHETEITVLFEAKGNETLMKFEQRLFQDQDARDKHNHGWSSSFGDLEELLA